MVYYGRMLMVTWAEHTAAAAVETSLLSRCTLSYFKYYRCCAKSRLCVISGFRRDGDLRSSGILRSGEW